MKKELQQIIEIPEGVEVKLEEGFLIVKGKEGENSREFKIGKLKLEKKENQIIIGYEKSTIFRS